MFSRRRFLGATSAGMLAASVGLSPLARGVSCADDSPDSRFKRLLRIKGAKDRLLGYPVNMNTPADAFFAWRKRLNETGA